MEGMTVIMFSAIIMFSVCALSAMVGYDFGKAEMKHERRFEEGCFAAHIRYILEERTYMLRKYHELANELCKCLDCESCKYATDKDRTPCRISELNDRYGRVSRDYRIESRDDRL